MFPYVTFLSIDLYTWMIILGVVVAVVVFRILTDVMALNAKVYNFSLIVCVCCVVVGYASAVVFQSFYHWMSTGEWLWNVGATFYGGLIGAIVAFAVGYFVVGHFAFPNKLHLAESDKVVACAFPCIVIAHSFGRIGCLFAGCCYGKPTDGWLGINMLVDGTWQRRLPTQLFEAIFLLLLFAVLVYLLVKKRSLYTPSVYLICYGVWRFAIEYIRDDDERGSSGISWLTPSQLTAIIMVVVGVGLVFLYKYLLKGWIDNVAKKVE